MQGYGYVRGTGTASINSDRSTPEHLNGELLYLS